MRNRRQLVRQTATILMACGLIASLRPGLAAAQGGAYQQPVREGAEVTPFVIFEDDFDSDSDGPAALSMLLELEAAGECKIIACGTIETQEYATATMAVASNGSALARVRLCTTAW